jgi:hypothetical protein
MLIALKRSPIIPIHPMHKQNNLGPSFDPLLILKRKFAMGELTEEE